MKEIVAKVYDDIKAGLIAAWSVEPLKITIVVCLAVACVRFIGCGG